MVDLQILILIVDVQIFIFFFKFYPTYSIRDKTKEFYTFFVYLLSVIAMEENQNATTDSSSEKTTFSGLIILDAAFVFKKCVYCS